jgi:hypothetical protein
VIVLSYLNTDWYPKQLRELTKPCAGKSPDSDPTRIICQRPFDRRTGPAFYDASRVPTRSILPMTDAQIDGIAASQVIQVQEAGTTFSARGITVPIQQGKYLFPSDQFVLSIIKEAWGDRPIFFASTTNVQFDLGLSPYVARQGLAFKLVTPQEGASLVQMGQGSEYSPILGQWMDVKNGEQLLDHVFQFHGLSKKEHWADDATRNIPIHYYYAYMAQAEAEKMLRNDALSRHYQTEGEKYEALSRR